MDIPKPSAAEWSWAFAGVGLVAGIVLVKPYVASIPVLSSFAGSWAGLIVGLGLVYIAMKYVHQHDFAALGFGAGFALVLDGVISNLVPSFAQTVTIGA